MNILLVEDHDDQALVAERVLSRHCAEWKVTVVGSGRACLDRLASIKCSVVILDYNLPDMTGLEVLARIKGMQPEASVVMVTGHGDEAIAVEAMKQGAADYLTKGGEYLTALPAVIEKVVAQGRLRQALAESHRRLSALSRISLDLSVARDLDLAAQILADGARLLTRSGVGLAIFLDPVTGLVERLKTSGITLHEPLVHTSIEGRGALGAALTGPEEPAVYHEGSEPLNSRVMPVHAPAIESAMVVPIRIQHRTSGVILVGNPDPEWSYREPEQAEVVLSLALHAAGVIQSLRSVEEARLQAITDGLTGLYNHRECQRRLEEEVERAQRYGRMLSLLMVDVDYFKAVNDTHGHQVGDLVLRHIAKEIVTQLRHVDICSRYGGEEFLLMLPETDVDAAGRVADRIVQAIAAGDLVLPSGRTVPLSVSIGVASFPADGDDRESLIAAADDALYTAKESGRNRAHRYREAARLAASESEVLKTLLEDPTVSAVKHLAAAVDAKSVYTRGHSSEVTQSAMAFAEHLALTNEQKDGLRIAGLLHNLGNASVPDRILAKPGPLTEEERKVIQAHPGLAELLGREAPRFRGVAQAILYHHERWDGHGYPRGLRGEEIPRLARILGLVEAYHAMTSPRPYRRRLTRDEAIRELRAGSGTQFDPSLVERFIESLPTPASDPSTAARDEAA